MRIIAGRLGGRVIASPRGSRTHPMSERIRGGLFNALGDIEGLSLLDAFAGSGALSFEAISRGALAVTAIDIDKKAFDAIKQNARELAVETSIKVVRVAAGSWSDSNMSTQFDIVIAAPPYDDLQPQLVAKLVRHIKVGGVFVLDWPGKQAAPELGKLKLVTTKNYGDAQLIFYRRPNS